MSYRNSCDKRILSKRQNCKQNSIVKAKCTDKGTLCFFSSLLCQCFPFNQRNISSRNQGEIMTNYLLKVLKSHPFLRKESFVHRDSSQSPVSSFLRAILTGYWICTFPRIAISKGKFSNVNVIL
jgi:hypothetical protein